MTTLHCAEEYVVTAQKDVELPWQRSTVLHVGKLPRQTPMVCDDVKPTKQKSAVRMSTKYADQDKATVQKDVKLLRRQATVTAS